ncbi:hypothetical protein [Streptomyces sp. Ag109_O5-10]|uniref:hypothetical protein n=1 Tax=Streptomyces sp. Ag109_O5-10 TaxID=1855349 RepID=UPI00115FF8E8|nr:hypothetical protein [Streptomyces sp. Ag109_O5-10]
MRSLDPALLAALRIRESAILVAEAVVTVAKALTDPGDSRPWQEKIESCFVDDGERLERIISSVVEEFGGVEEVKTWLENFNGDSYRKFAEKLLGAARYRLLIQAFQEDAAVLALAVRRGVRALMPFAIAWGDALSLVSKNQIKPASRAQFLAFNAVDMVLGLDAFLGEKVLSSLPMARATGGGADLEEWKKEESDDLVAKFRKLVTESSMRRVERANSSLVRKIRGARDALTYSEDGVSQAANSLIELIDRIMREAFPPSVVLAWVDTNFPDEPETTHIQDGVRKPTKRAESLCFIYGGEPVLPREPTQFDDGTGPSPLHDVLARVLVSARNKLQKMKHFDSGSPEEREQIGAVLSALEGALMLGLAIGGVSADKTHLPELPAA